MSLRVQICPATAPPHSEYGNWFIAPKKVTIQKIGQLTLKPYKKELIVTKRATRTRFSSISTMIKTENAQDN